MRAVCGAPMSSQYANLHQKSTVIWVVQSWEAGVFEGLKVVSSLSKQCKEIVAYRFNHFA
jgi:hypothetical protein